ncbi:MAG: 16S rRNA (guanine(527)-N(7))-methyltransferase RsmG [Planctomycetaceae bacterium]|nr:16S rRNA (guanine(527)-N(7))-methyltransferase RsmG [Planctomycetaceae bacterium]
MTSTSEQATEIRTLAANHGMIIEADKSETLAHYCQLVWSWNERLNLTRHTTNELFVIRDLLDTVRLADHIPQNATVLDVGSGGGVPGIPLAILRPDLAVSLCESVGKKAAALTEIVKQLGIPVNVYSSRVQDLLPQKRFAWITVRAVGALDKLLPWFPDLRQSGSTLLLIKGPKWTEELQEAQKSGNARGRRIERLASWASPGRDGNSVLLRVQ